MADRSNVLNPNHPDYWQSRGVPRPADVQEQSRQVAANRRAAGQFEYAANTAAARTNEERRAMGRVVTQVEAAAR